MTIWLLALGADFFRRLCLPLCYLGACRWLRRVRPASVLHRDGPGRAQLRREFGQYVRVWFLSILPFLFLLASPAVRAHLQVYASIEQHGWPYFFFSGAVYLVGFDLYFYVVHRILHTELLYRHIHVVHHVSRRPSALTGLCVHPIEGLLLHAYAPLMMMAMPIHGIWVLALSWGFFWLTSHVHAGVVAVTRPLPGPLHALVVTAHHHDLHHRDARHNYAMGLNLWDVLFRTNHPEYRRE